MCRRYDFLYKQTLPAEVRAAKAELKRAAGDEAAQRRAQKHLSRLQQRLHTHEQQTLGAEVRVCFVETSRPHRAAGSYYLP